MWVETLTIWATFSYRQVDILISYENQNIKWVEIFTIWALSRVPKCVLKLKQNKYHTLNHLNSNPRILLKIFNPKSEGLTCNVTSLWRLVDLLSHTSTKCWVNSFRDEIVTHFWARTQFEVYNYFPINLYQWFTFSTV